MIIAFHLAHAEGLEAVFLGLHQGQRAGEHQCLGLRALRAAAVGVAVEHQLKRKKREGSKKKGEMGEVRIKDMR